MLAANEVHTFNQTKIMRKQLIRISILQSSKIMTALYVLMGFIYTLVGLPMIIFGGEKLRIMGIVYLAMPVIMGIFGFIFFVIFAAVYNGLAKLLGGFEVEIKDIDHAA
jgi:TRAP-type C4-dicarboxylate transport system permease small subunit